MFIIIEVGVLVLLVVASIAMIVIKNQINKMSAEERQNVGIRLPHYAVLREAEQKEKAEERV